MISRDRWRHPNRLKQRPGYSLLELLVSIALMVMIFVVVVNAVISALHDNKARQATIAATDRANQIVRSVVSLIRQAEDSPVGAYPLVAATNTSLTLYTATGGGTAVEKARIFLNGSTLQLGTIQPASGAELYPAGNEVLTTLLTGIQNGSQPLFQFYDATYTGTQAAMNPITLPAIRLVKMTVIFDDNPNTPPAASTIELQAQLRNLKDNY